VSHFFSLLVPDKALSGWRTGSRLDDYLALIERDRQCRPAEAMLADEIMRLRAS